MVHVTQWPASDWNWDQALSLAPFPQLLLIFLLVSIALTTHSLANQVAQQNYGLDQLSALDQRQDVTA
jgi:hypothetical protein